MAKKKPRRKPTCHPGRKHYGSGLCSACWQRQRRAKNPEEARAYKRQWYSSNRERVLRRLRNSYKTNGERLRRQARERRLRNLDAVRLLDRLRRKRDFARVQRTYRKWYRSPAGFLTKAYLAMRARVSDGRARHARWHGLPILPRENFIAWSRSNADFWRIYRAWVASGYSRRLSPSVNRIDVTDGYVPGNIEWVTHSVNSALASRHQSIPASIQKRIYASLSA